MKITVKTTQQKVFQVDVDGSDTVADLKAKIHQSQGHAVEAQKIIYSGKILADDKSIDSCGIKEKDFLVLMVSKPKPAQTSTSSTPAPVPESSAPAPPSEVQSSAPAPAPAAPEIGLGSQNQDAAPSASPAAFGDPSAFLSGETLQAAINNMVEMGFPRDQVLRAMRASFNNADRAVEYLMNGIPSHLEPEGPRQSTDSPSSIPPQAVSPASPPAAQQATQNQGQPQNLFQLAQQQQQGGTAVGTGGPVGGGHTGHLNLEALRDNPQIQQLRDQVAQNPALIQPLIQQLASQNPAMAQMIAQNPEALMQLLGMGEQDESGPIPPGAHVVSVTEEERAAIQRLEALGFPRQAVLEAYFACDKNEELAANYLFEGGFDD